jgi:hypothetical protein
MARDELARYLGRGAAVSTPVRLGPADLLMRLISRPTSFCFERLEIALVLGGSFEIAAPWHPSRARRVDVPNRL